MRSENESVHYRARFELRASRRGCDPAKQVINVLQNWFVGKERMASRNGIDVASRLYGRDASTFSINFSAGSLSLPAGYEGGIGLRGVTSVCARAVAEDDERSAFWAFEYDEPDSKVAFRHWHTSVGISGRESSGFCTVNIRVSYYMMPGYVGKQPFVPPSTTPRFVKSMIELPDIDVYVGESKILREECYLDSRSFESFEKSLLSPVRTLPLVLITTDYNGATAVWDATELADKVLGMANVYVFDWRDSKLKHDGLFRLFAKGTPAYRYNCAMSTLRIYHPGVDLNDSLGSGRHRFFKKDDIDAQRYGNRDEFVETISRSLSRGFVTNEDDVIDIDDVRRKQSERTLRELSTRTDELRKRVRVAQQERRDHVPSHDSENEIRYLREQLTAAQSEALEWEQLATEYSEASLNSAIENLNSRIHSLENDLAKSDDNLRSLSFRVDTLIDENAGLRSDNDSYKTIVRVIEGIGHIPSTLTDEIDLLCALWPSKVVATDSAYRSAADFTSGDLDEQWQILSSIPVVLWDLYFGAGSGGDISGRYYERAGYELALTETKLTKNNASMMREREAEYQGKIVDCRPHIKGKDKNPKRAFRAHFYVDRAGGKIVLGHCGGHLTTAGTQRIR